MHVGIIEFCVQKCHHSNNQSGRRRRKRSPPPKLLYLRLVVHHIYFGWIVNVRTITILEILAQAVDGPDIQNPSRQLESRSFSSFKSEHTQQAQSRSEPNRDDENPFRSRRDDDDDDNE